MSNQQLSISFVSKSSSRDSAEQLLQLEQSDWAPYTGMVTKIKGVRFLLDYLYDEDGDWDIDCGLVGGNLVALIYAYPAYPSVAYRLYTTHGTLSERLVETLTKTETITFANTDTESLKYPVTDILSTEIVGDMWDKYGAPAGLPAVSVDDGDVVLSEPRYGAVKITYTVHRHVYSLTIEPREDAIMDLFGAVVYALVTGANPEWLELDVPHNADEIAEGIEECGWGGGTGTGTFPEDPDSVPDDTGASATVRYNQCTGEILSSTVIGT